MKPIRPSNSKAQCRVLCAVLLGITALWAMPRSVQAQLYVGTGNMVSEYNATTGAAINPNFITGTSGSLALSGNNLFVGSVGTVGKYDATMGVAINANFITGLDIPFLGGAALSLDGTALFVVNNTNTVGEYNATTGAAINPNFVTGL